jgi:hypothetical protein
MKILENLPNMKFSNIMKLWLNAIRIIADERQKKTHSNARKVLDAIGAEWTKREKWPAEPGEFFHWPTTETTIGDGQLETDHWLKEGMLNYMGYKVGVSGERKLLIRQNILTEVFSGSLPPVFPREYNLQWGNPNTSQRLQKIANTISALTRNAKRRHDSKMELAVADWEQDLEFLYYLFYVGKFQFDWPSIDVRKQN